MKNNLKKKSKKNNPMDLIELILKDHKELWKLIKIMKSEKALFLDKKNAFNSFVPALIAHSKPEEKTWYLSMKEDHDMNIESLEGDVEHVLANQLCKELKNTSDKDLFVAKLKVLAELVEHHLEEEEEDLMPDYKKSSNSEERIELGQKYLKIQMKYNKA